MTKIQWANNCSPRLYLSLSLILRLSLSLFFEQMVVKMRVVCSSVCLKSFLTEAKYKTETKAEAENSEVLNYS